MNWAQEELFRNLHYLNIILKARQLGCTTFVSLLMLDACLFNPNVRSGIIAHTREDAEEIFRDKVKFPFEKLCEDYPDFAEHTEAEQDSVRSLLFNNNSQFRVGTSLRGGTFQWLHITEYGKVCAKYPEKAREIRTGALNTVQAGQFITIESTAEGQAGDFYDKCQKAQGKLLRDEPLTKMDFRFFFFPWWKEPTYVLDPEGVTIPQEYADYFARLEEAGLPLRPEQKAWYVKKAEQQQDDMKREYPSTPEEAFEAAIEGAIYAAQMQRAERDGRICKLPVLAGVPVNTFWDIGLNDDMAVWLHQQDGPWNNFIGYHAATGAGWGYFKRWMDEFALKHDVSFGKHYGPHDIGHRQHTAGMKPRTVKEIAREAGIRFEDGVPRTDDVWADIQDARGKFGSCRFDIERCSEGIKALRQYCKEYDEKREVYKNIPLHNWASHGADAFRTFTKGYKPDTDKSDWDKPLELQTGTIA